MEALPGCKITPLGPCPVSSPRSPLCLQNRSHPCLFLSRSWGCPRSQSRSKKGKAWSLPVRLRQKQVRRKRKQRLLLLLLPQGALQQEEEDRRMLRGQRLHRSWVGGLLQLLGGGQIHLWQAEGGRSMEAGMFYFYRSTVSPATLPIQLPA